MSPLKPLITTLFILFPTISHAITLTTGQENYTTTTDITTTDEHGISSTLTGSEESPNSIINNHIITTGNDGASSGDYGIRVINEYYNVTNNGTIQTTGNSGRGISINELSSANNNGTITTQGTSSYGIYAYGHDNTISNSGTITTNNSSSYGIYLSTSDNNTVTNSGTINSQTYGIYATGNDNQIINTGIINTTVGSSAHGIFVSRTGASGTSIDNSGTITSSSHGIFTKDDDMTIINSGTITSSDSESDYAIKNEDNDNMVITNAANGILNSTTYAIYNTGTNAIINNYGTINGGIYLGDATLNLFGGGISGDVDGVAQAGSINIGSASTAASFTQNTHFIDLNTLTIHDGSTLDSYASITATTIKLDDNATLNIYDGSSISGAITGVGSSSGTINISGTDFTNSSTIGSASNSIANLTLNDGASLTSNHDLYISDITLNHGSLNLNNSNNLTVFGNVTGTGSGTINIGNNSHSIDGNLTLTSGDTLSVELGNATSGNLTITGNANIDATARLAITNSADQGYIESGTNVTILTSQGGSINAIDDANISIDGSHSNQKGLLTYTTAAANNNLTLTITRLSAAEVTSNKNAQDIYQTIHDIGANATESLSAFQSYLDNSTSSRTDIINQLAPQSSKALITNNINIANNVANPIETRLDQSHQTDDFEEGLWIHYFASTANQDDIKDDEGFNLNSFGLILASDHEIWDAHRFGTALSYTKSTITSANNLKDTHVRSYQFNLYHSYVINAYFLDSLIGFIYNQYESEREITAVSQKTKSHFNGHAAIARIRTGYSFPLNHKLTLTPELNLNVVKTAIDDYSEKGADSLNLQIDAISADFLETRAGINVGYVTKLFTFPEFKQFATNVKLSYGRSLTHDTPSTTSRFAGHSNQFNTHISHTNRNSLKLTTQITAYHIDDLTFSTNYNIEHQETFQSHSLFFKIHQRF